MWIKHKPELKPTELYDFGGGPAVAHSVMCWLCDERSAIYDMHPNWIFRPCRECQERCGLNKNKSWFKKLFNHQSKE